MSHVVSAMTFARADDDLIDEIAGELDSVGGCDFILWRRAKMTRLVVAGPIGARSIRRVPGLECRMRSIGQLVHDMVDDRNEWIVPVTSRTASAQEQAQAWCSRWIGGMWSEVAPEVEEPDQGVQETEAAPDTSNVTSISHPRRNRSRKALQEAREVISEAPADETPQAMLKRIFGQAIPEGAVTENGFPVTDALGRLDHP